MATRTDEERRVLAALHRVYIASLPAEQQEKVLAMASDDVKGLDVVEALRIIEASGLDQLRKWHVIASALDRNPDLLGNETTTDAIVDVVRSGTALDKQVLIDRLNKFAKDSKEAR